MILPQQLFDLFEKNELIFYTGVPDSLLKDFCAYVIDNAAKENHIIAANEGNAVSLAAGYNLATGKVGVVYLQNSGLGNAVNPLTSLTDKEVYSVPLLLVIGWRGEPGKKDESQHKKMGKIMLPLLEKMEIPYSILPNRIEEVEEVVRGAVAHLSMQKSPYALIVKEETFEPYTLRNKKETNFPLNREEALKIITFLLEEDAIVVSTTGKASRELFEYRAALGHGHKKDFLMVGAMGHASSIALSIALHKPGKKVYCFDGDGALIMHMGALSTIGKLHPKNFKHIVFNNFAHDSVGGQPTAADAIDIPAIAKASGYKFVFTAETEEEIKARVKEMKKMEELVLLEVRCNRGARKDLCRPTRTPIENKEDFVRFLKE